MSGMTKEQFSALISQYERLVYTICFQLVRDAAAAEDLTQETFLSAYLHRSSMPPGYERQWLGRIAANKAKDYLQSAWNRRTLLPGDDAIPPGLSAGGTHAGRNRKGAGAPCKNHTHAAVARQTLAAAATGKEGTGWSCSIKTAI